MQFQYSKRFFVAILMFLGQVITSLLKSNINMAIVEMTSNKTITIDNRTITQPAEFDWNSRQKAWILSAKPYGGIIASFGGHLALKYGGSTMIFIGALISSLSCLLNPIVARYDYYVYVLIRVLDGIGVTLKFLSVSELWSQWSPMEDRAKLIAITFSGMYAGSTISFFVSGLIIKHFGWPASFYFTGGLGICWTLLWVMTVPNDPATDKCISRRELDYIKANRMETKPKNMLKLWKNMIKSKPVLAMCFAKCVHDAGLAIVIVFIPMYIKDITNTGIDKVGIYASIPNVISIFAMPLCGYVMDALQNTGTLTITQVHKLFIGVGFICASIMIFATAYFSSQFAISIICLTCFKITLSIAFVVTLIVANCLAPQCPSVVNGFAVMFHHVSFIGIPMLVGYIVTEHKASQWSLCFSTIGILLLLGTILYMIFGSSEPQGWSYGDDPSQQREELHAVEESQTK